MLRTCLLSCLLDVVLGPTKLIRRVSYPCKYRLSYSKACETFPERLGFNCFPPPDPYWKAFWDLRNPCPATSDVRRCLIWLAVGGSCRLWSCMSPAPAGPGTLCDFSPPEVVWDWGQQGRISWDSQQVPPSASSKLWHLNKMSEGVIITQLLCLSSPSFCVWVQPALLYWRYLPIFVSYLKLSFPKTE